jgi:hypothetical protein
MPAVIHRDTGADACTHLGEIQSDAIGPADAIIFRYHNMTHVHADAPPMIENDLADGVVNEAGEKAGAHAQTRQGMGDIVFSTARPHFKRSGKFDAPMPLGAEANHALAQTHQIKTA